MTNYMQIDKEGLEKIRVINSKLMTLEQLSYDLLNDIEDCKFTTTFFIKNNKDLVLLQNKYEEVSQLVDRLKQYL